MKEPGLDNRHRDRDGRIDSKRSDTKISTLRQTYGPDFVKGMSGDKTLGDLRQKTGQSLSQMVRGKRK